jgi:hypothetical protein
MRFNLGKLLAAPVMMAAAALATNSAMASTLLKVPFSFTVAGHNCPAGLYMVQRDTTGGLVTLSSRDSSRSFSWVLEPGNPDPMDSRVVLTFDDFGETRALQSVQFGPMITPRLDKKARRSEHPTQRMIAGQ